MKIKIFAAYRDGMDGSFSIRLFGEKQKALDHLDRTEEQLEEGNVYDDGAIAETEIEVDDQGVIIKSGHLSIG